MDAGAKFLSIVALTALASGDSWLSILVALVSGASTILSVVLDFPGMAAKHEELAKEYVCLLSEYMENQAKDTQVDRDIKADRKRREIQLREPSVLRGLAQICTDEVEAVIHHDVPMNRLSMWRRFKAHFGGGEMPPYWESQETEPK
ncbi:MAG: hypothetical protein CML16_03165 [Pusillimonas sp.]|nr:hypothetical protein [Pusillimonas sp.]MBC43587.1 hypothetical protein [Pusillimonas sp.]HCP78970.1 hypothetical protein [Pusillimonas sp.]|tara:strand:- start:12020 stop:12460 length:441 start_codon:yes stop_codon:yes gene_type:complete